MLPAAAAEHYRNQQRITVATLAAARRAWSALGVGDFDAAWATLGPQLLVLLSAAQLRAASDAAEYIPAVAVELGLDAGTSEAVNARAFAGVASDGRDLLSLLYQPIVATRTALGQGQSLAASLATGGSLLDSIVGTQVADASRAAESVAIASRPAIGGYVRMLAPPSCSRCAILAGKWFRWNQGFLRHPHCDCRHIPAAEHMAEDLTTDPYAYFRSLTPAQQEKAFGRANAAAINDGADIYQVVNAGRRSRGLTTAEGVSSRRGFAAQALHGGPLPRGARPTMTRLTPEGIYARAGSREEALTLLRQHGYLTGHPQVSGGVITGQREGLGQLARGGSRVGARNTVLEARRTGIRDPNNRATMTVAERRAFDERTGRAAMTPEQRRRFDRLVRQGASPEDARRRVTAGRP